VYPTAAEFTLHRPNQISFLQAKCANSFLGRAKNNAGKPRSEVHHAAIINDSFEYRQRCPANPGDSPISGEMGSFFQNPSTLPAIGQLIPAMCMHRTELLVDGSEFANCEFQPSIPSSNPHIPKERPVKMGSSFRMSKGLRNPTWRKQVALPANPAETVAYRLPG
jgi:hypothetical protein